ncbi:hydroxymethylglutaryl-CoA reductase [Lentisalinibacter orientalis]|uniref:hydroxymethylglutaryl-CoA reductase n=1 Tax=Lentisalinibacter orientalis TaxID=2992241 RepID=UPI00386B2EFA
MPRIPRDRDNDYSEEAVRSRREFITEQTGTRFTHLASYSLDPATLRGNIENFTGVAQMPVGYAGPLLVNGEHAEGEFYVPMATTEGTLVASYNRGMSITREAGGITTTIADDAMQRAPVFVFPSAREARAFGEWVSENFAGIKAAAEATTSVGKLRDIEQYAASRMLYLRFNFTTGDAAGQNMAGKAALAACHWIVEQYGRVEYYLSGNMDTDKKHSTLNSLHSRGKRVIAEVTIPDALLRDRMRVSAEQLFATRRVSQLGALMAGAVYNGVHPANAIAATFIATGQDEANVAESHAAFTYAEVTRTGDFYYSITLPSLIVATYGGGTGLATQRECLESLGCYGPGKARKLAEIIAATVLCGEISLGAAVVAEEWVSSHETYGRNR